MKWNETNILGIIKCLIWRDLLIGDTIQNQYLYLRSSRNKIYLSHRTFHTNLIIKFSYQKNLSFFLRSKYNTFCRTNTRKQLWFATDQKTRTCYTREYFNICISISETITDDFLNKVENYETKISTNTVNATKIMKLQTIEKF